MADQQKAVFGKNTDECLLCFVEKKLQMIALETTSTAVRHLFTKGYFLTGCPMHAYLIIFIEITAIHLKNQHITCIILD